MPAVSATTGAAVTPEQHVRDEPVAAAAAQQQQRSAERAELDVDGADRDGVRGLLAAAAQPAHLRRHLPAPPPPQSAPPAGAGGRRRGRQVEAAPALGGGRLFSRRLVLQGLAAPDGDPGAAASAQKPAPARHHPLPAAGPRYPRGRNSAQPQPRGQLGPFVHPIHPRNCQKAGAHPRDFRVKRGAPLFLLCRSGLLN